MKGSPKVGMPVTHPHVFPHVYNFPLLWTLFMMFSRL